MKNKDNNKEHFRIATERKKEGKDKTKVQIVHSASQSRGKARLTLHDTIRKTNSALALTQKHATHIKLFSLITK